MRTIATTTFLATTSLAALFAWAPLGVVMAGATVVGLVGVALGLLAIFAGRAPKAPARTILELLAAAREDAELADSLFGAAPSSAVGTAPHTPGARRAAAAA